MSQIAAQARRQGNSVDEEALRQNIIRNFGADNLETLDAWGYILLLGAVAAAVVVGLSARDWANIGRSRKLARRAWYIVLGTPLLCSVLPWAQFLDIGHLSPKDAKVLEGMLATSFGLQVFVTIGPKLISVFPGLMRAGMTLKTLFHESATPAYITMLAAPVFALFLLVIFSAVIQMEGTILLFAGVAGLLGSAVVYLWKSRDLVRSHTRDEAFRMVKRIRFQAAIFSISGTALLAIYLFTAEWIPFIKVVTLGLFAGGNLFLTIVVGSDFLLALLHKEFQLAKQFQGSEFAAEYERKMDLLAAAGLTDLGTGVKPA